MAKDATPRKYRRLRRLLVILVLGPLFAIALLPTLLSTSPARSGLLAVANRYLAPGRIEAGGLRVSWLGSLELSGVVLYHPHGKRVVAIPRATLDRSLLELLLDRSSLGTLILEGPAIDVERRLDGSIDVVDLISMRATPAGPRDHHADNGPLPASNGVPNVDLTLKIIKGTLRVQAPELTEPMTVDRFDLTVEATAAPGPLNFLLRMENGSGARVSALGIDGTFDLRAKPGTSPDLSLNVLARGWPFGVSVAGVAARGQLDGQVEVDQKSGRWDLKGDTRLLNLDVSGAALAGDRLRLDLVTAVWDIVQGAGTKAGSEAWAVRRLSLSSPVAKLSANGPILGMPGTGASLDGQVDLAALARQLPHALRLRDGLTLEHGEAGLRIDLGYQADALSVEVAAQLSDLVAHEGAKTVALNSPAKLDARVTQRGSNLHVERLSVTSDFLQTNGSGDLDQGIKVTGAADLRALQTQLRDLVDFGGVELGGRGEYTVDYRRTGASFTSGFSSEFRGLDLKGLRSEPVRRESMKLQAALSGPCDGSGIPQAVGDLKVGLAAGQIGAFATAATQNGTMALSLVATGPLTLSEQTGGAARGDLKFTGAWHAPALEIGELRLNIHPANVPAEASASALALAVRGRYDGSKGEVILNPVAGTPAGAVGLAAEGLHITGLGQPAGALKVEGSLVGDLAALDQLIATLNGGANDNLAGSWTGRISVQPRSDGRLQLAVRFDSLDLSVAGAEGQPRRQEGPLALAVRAGYKPEGSQLDIEELGVVTRYASLEAKGQIADATGKRVADLQGTLHPNWPTINTLVASSLEPGASLQGGAPRAFRIKGPLSGGSMAETLKGLDADLGVDLAGAQAFGLKLGPTPLIVRCCGGRTIIDPIVTTLNNGKVLLQPELALDDPKGLTLRLLPGSSLQDIEINDEVSHKVLTYIAPVLDEATQVHGSVSATFTRAEFPIGGDASRTMTVIGAVVFNNVVFGAGPLGGELLSLAGKGKDTVLHIQQPLQLAIADRRIHQSGLEIPLNAQTKITVKGSVGFDQTLALRADVPINGAMLGRDKMLQGLAGGQSIPVPIGGTLSHPKVDRQALAAAMREVGKSILKGGAKDEATEVLKRFLR